MPGRQGRAVFLGVDQHHVGGPQRRLVDQPEEGLARAAIQPPVPGRVTGADQMIQHHGYPPEQQPGQVHVEVAQVADQDHVRRGQPAGQPDQRQPAPGQPGEQGRRVPWVGQHGHPGRGVQSQRRVALSDRYPVVPQARAENANSRVRRGVISAE